MRIGLTYDLKSEANEGVREQEAEYDSPETIDALSSAIEASGHDVVRIGGLEDLMRALVRGERWDLVFNIAEGRGRFGREAQIPAVLEAYAIPYTFSDPLTLTVSLHKGIAKRLVREAELATSPFVVVEEPGELQDLDLSFPLFAKPVAEGSGIGIDQRGRADDFSTLECRVRELLERYHQPVLIEHYLDGREYTVGIIGTGSRARVLGTLAVESRRNTQSVLDVYGHTEKERYEEFVRYRLVDGSESREIETLALEVHRTLGCRDLSRVDIRCDANGRPHFLEINPLPGLHPTRSDLVILARHLGLAYTTLIADILTESLDRLGRHAI